MNNHILVPTDFSEYANFAVETAMKLAKQFNATIHFLTVWDLPPNEALKHKKRLALSTLKERYNSVEVPVKAVYLEGALVKTIDEYVKRYSIDLVVMGSHGASGFSEVIIGSNTQKIVRSVHCPILVIKQTVENVDFQNIVFASDFSLKEKEVFKRFLEFINAFSNPKIHLVAVNTSSFFNQPEFLLRDAMKQFKNMAGEIPCSTNIQYDFNVETGIEFFSKEINADLIVVSNYQKSMLRKLFIGSTVEALVNHSENPILSLDF